MKRNKHFYVICHGLISLAFCAVPAQAQLTAPLPSGNTPTAPRISPPLNPVVESTRLKPGDIVRITVIGFPEFSSEQAISAEGTVFLPMADEIRIIGLSSEEIISRLEAALEPYIRRPQVSFTLISVSPLRVSVTGEVASPGPRLLQPEEVGDSNVIKLSEVLIAAGGITPEADLRNIIIRRQRFPGLASSTKQDGSTMSVNLWEVVQSGNLYADPEIQDGDEIIIPTAVSSNVDQQTLLSSTLAPEFVVVNVSGEVRRPGPVEVSPSADANAAIAAAGGPTPDADTGSILLARMGEDGQLIREEFQFGNQSTPIRDGDIVYVKKSASSNTLDFFNAITTPIRVLLELF